MMFLFGHWGFSTLTEQLIKKGIILLISFITGIIVGGWFYRFHQDALFYTNNRTEITVNTILDLGLRIVSQMPAMHFQARKNLDN